AEQEVALGVGDPGARVARALVHCGDRGPRKHLALLVGDRPGDRARDLLGVRPVDPERQHERGGCEAQEPSGRHQALLLKSFPGTDRRKRAEAQRDRNRVDQPLKTASDSLWDRFYTQGCITAFTDVSIPKMRSSGWTSRWTS